MIIGKIVCGVVIVVFMYLSEYIAFSFWYKKYIRTNIPCKTFVKRMVKYYRSIMLSPDIKDRSEEPQASSLLLMFSVFLPLLTPIFVLASDNLIYRIFVFSICVSLVPGRLFKEDKRAASENARKWIRYLDRFESGAVGRRKEEEEESEEEAIYLPTRGERRRELILSIMTIIGAVGLLVVIALSYIPFFRDGSWLNGIPILMFGGTKYDVAFAICFIFFMVSALLLIYGNKQARDKEKQRVMAWADGKRERAEHVLGFRRGIYVDYYTEEWKKTIVRICEILKIKEVAVVCEKSLPVNFAGTFAITARRDEGIPTVVISSEEVERLRKRFGQQTTYNMVRFLIGHELTHIRYKEFNVRRRLLKQIASFFVMVFLMRVEIYVFSKYLDFLPMAMTICNILMIIQLFFVLLVFGKARYWNYISEYRADRKSSFISGAPFPAIEALLRWEAERNGTEQILKLNRRINGRRRRRSSTHPDYEQRISELKRKKKWGITEYFRYAVQVMVK